MWDNYATALRTGVSDYESVDNGERRMSESDFDAMTKSESKIVQKIFLRKSAVY
jgi:hypothetical protein